MFEYESPWGKIPLFVEAPKTSERELLHFLAQINLLPGSRILVLGLGSGLLPAALGLRKYQVTAVSDSASEQRLCLLTWMELGLEESHLVLADLVNIPRSEYQAVLVYEPRRPELWDFWLQEARRFVGAEKPIYAVGPGETAIAEWKKWIGAIPWGQEKETVLSGILPEGIGVPWFARKHEFPPLRARLVLHPASALEIPSRSENLVLRHYPRPDQRQNILVFGNEGILTALASARVNAGAKIWYVSDSFSAVWSARESFSASGIGDQGNFLVNDRLDDFEKHSFDAVFGFLDDAKPVQAARESLEKVKPGKEVRLVCTESVQRELNELKELCDVKVLAQGDGIRLVRLVSLGV